MKNAVAKEKEAITARPPGKRLSMDQCQHFSCTTYCGTSINCQIWLISLIDEVDLVLPLNLHASRSDRGHVEPHFTMVRARRSGQSPTTRAPLATHFHLPSLATPLHLLSLLFYLHPLPITLSLPPTPPSPLSHLSLTPS